MQIYFIPLKNETFIYKNQLIEVWSMYFDPIYMSQNKVI